MSKLNEDATTAAEERDSALQTLRSTESDLERARLDAARMKKEFQKKYAELQRDLEVLRQAELERARSTVSSANTNDGDIDEMASPGSRGTGASTTPNNTPQNTMTTTPPHLLVVQWPPVAYSSSPHNKWVIHSAPAASTTRTRFDFEEDDDATSSAASRRRSTPGGRGPETTVTRESAFIREHDHQQWRGGDDEYDAEQPCQVGCVLS